MEQSASSLQRSKTSDLADSFADQRLTCRVSDRKPESSANKLSPEQRSDIARSAAAVRWAIPRATHRGILAIGDTRIPCAVLEDGRRVLTESGIAIALLGSRSGASKRLKKMSSETGNHVPVFLAPERLKPFVSQEMIEGPLKPVRYLDGTRQVVGYDASILPTVCDIWLRARDAGILQAQQVDKAQRADLLMRGLAQVGIVALVDEATGYQEVRDRMVLQAILYRYLRTELAAWAKRFPDEFYREMFRLKGWSYNPLSVIVRFREKGARFRSYSRMLDFSTGTDFHDSS